MTDFQDNTFIRGPQEDRYRADGTRYQYQRYFYYDGLCRLDHTWDYESGRRGGSNAYDVLTMCYDGNRLTSITTSTGTQYEGTFTVY